MADTTSGTRLQRIGVDYRDEHLIQNDYQRNVNDYDENQDWLQEKGGKGTNGASNTYILPNENASKNSYANTVDTSDGGGNYDINGNPSVNAGNNGRKWAQTINIYSPNKEYGVDESERPDGQFINK